MGFGGGIAGLQKRLEHELRLLRADPAMPRMLRPVVLCAQGEPLPMAGGKGDGLGAWPLSPQETAAWRGAAIACCEGLHDGGAGGFASILGNRSNGSSLRVHSSGAVGQRDSGRGWLLPEAFRRSPLPSTRGALKAGGAAVERWDAAGNKQA